MVHESGLHDSAKIPCLVNIWFFSYVLKCSQPIRLQYSLLITLEGINQPLTFLHGDDHQGKAASEITTFN